MKNTIPIGTRGMLKDFLDMYNIKFLKKCGLKTYEVKPEDLGLSGYTCMIKRYTVATKYGEIVVKPDRVLTYVGDGKWDVRYD